jgi:hypothetical protein
MRIGGMTTIVTERIRKYHTFIDDPRKLARGAHVCTHTKGKRRMLHRRRGYNKSNGEGIARVLEEHIGKSNIEELFVKELASKGAGYARIFGGDMNLDWDKATATRKRRWKEATANTERAAPGQYGWIGQQPSSGFCDRPPATLGVFASLDRF